MIRTTLPLLLVLLAACGVQELEAIIAMYDTFGSTGTTGDTDASTGGGSTTSTGDSDTSSTSADASTSNDETGTGGASDTGFSSSSSSSTGPTPSFCGDGIIDPDETCDDMNDDPDDGCKLCTRDRIVFASSVKYQGFALDGLFGADQRCRMLAALAMLPNFGTYRAWLSDSTTAAADRFLHSKGRYVLVNGLVVADDWDALVSGSLEHSISVTESSQTSNGFCTWTGTFANGQPAFGSSFCGDWNDGDGLQYGGNGIGDQLGEWWSFFEQGPCGGECAIYCFEN